MQLKLAFLEQTTPPPDAQPAGPASTTWEGLGEATRVTALEKLATLIARMLAAAPASCRRRALSTMEASDE
jgi:hypothetical protein